MKRDAFTLIELLIVMSVIAVLAGLLIAAFGSTSKVNQVRATKSTCDAIAAAITIRGNDILTLPSGALRPAWDFNGDGMLDGDPKRTFTPELAAEAASIGYRGAMADLGLETMRLFIDTRTSTLIDSWHQPLRISFDDLDYGATGFSVWSIGPDGVAGTDDDIHSHRL